MAVSNPATFASIKAEFGGSNNFKDYYRGGPYVAASAAAGISTTAAGLRMSQFNGVTAYTPVSATASPTRVDYTNYNKGTWVMGTSTVTASGGNGSYTYSLAFLSGSTDDGNGTSITATISGNVVTFREVNISARTSSTLLRSTWRVTVSDGTSSTYVDIQANAS